MATPLCSDVDSLCCLYRNIRWSRTYCHGVFAYIKIRAVNCYVVSQAWWLLSSWTFYTGWYPLTSLWLLFFFFPSLTDARFSVMSWRSNSHWNHHPLLWPRQIRDMDQWRYGLLLFEPKCIRIASHISIGIWLLLVFGFVFLHMELVKSLCSVSSFSQSRVKLCCTATPDSKKIHHVKV